MKKLYLTLFIPFSAVLSAFAQSAPSITSANNFAIWEANITYLADTTNIVPGASGANVTWDFSSLKAVSPPDSSVSEFVPISSTPYPNDFPSANLATGSASGQTYLYLTYKNNTYTIVGEEGPQTSNGQTVTVKQIYDKPEVLYTFPLTYQTNQNGTYAAHYDLQGTTVYRNGTLKVTGDAYGTLKIMNKTYTNVLRLHAITTEADTIGGLPGYEIDYLIESWSYVTPGKKDNIFTISNTTETIFGSSQTVKSVTYNINSKTAGIADNNVEISGFQLYPNPTRQNCRLTYTSAMEGHSDIQILNQLGQNVKSLNNLTLRTGENNFDLILNGLPNGIYYVRVSAGAESHVQKLVIE
jgi:hypothetical protein